MDIIKKQESKRVGVGGWTCKCCGKDKTTRDLAKRAVRRNAKQEQEEN